jgi:hypothetical protein
MFRPMDNASLDYAPLDDASLGKTIPWTMHPLDMASLTDLSCP